tara:strand:- start:6993 stop:7391 length:399 start_codon:yes stop_codon:yes gene_type:complete
MDQSFSQQQEEFRRDKLSVRSSEKVRTGERLSKEDDKEWHVIINVHSWFANQRPVECGASRYTIGRACTLADEEAIQLYGGIGGTGELPLSCHAERRPVLGHQLIDEDHHLEGFSMRGRSPSDVMIRERAIV